jgi:hypothetical protein
MKMLGIMNPKIIAGKTACPPCGYIYVEVIHQDSSWVDHSVSSREKSEAGNAVLELLLTKPDITALFTCQLNGLH